MQAQYAEKLLFKQLALGLISEQAKVSGRK
jgi:hypothetical protein